MKFGHCQNCLRFREMTILPNYMKICPSLYLECDHGFKEVLKNFECQEFGESKINFIYFSPYK